MYSIQCTHEGRGEEVPVAVVTSYHWPSSEGDPPCWLSYADWKLFHTYSWKMDWGLMMAIYINGRMQIKKNAGLHKSVFINHKISIYFLKIFRWVHVLFLFPFKASALWADAFYKSLCPYVCPCVCVCVSVCLSVCSLLRYHLNIYFSHFPKSDVQNS